MTPGTSQTGGLRPQSEAQPLEPPNEMTFCNFFCTGWRLRAVILPPPLAVPSFWKARWLWRLWLPGGYSTLSWVRMCGPKFRPPPYRPNKTREDANLLPISKPFVSWRALFKTNQCFLQCKLGCISTFWQPIDKPKDKFIRNYAFCKNATYI